MRQPPHVPFDLDVPVSLDGLTQRIDYWTNGPHISMLRLDQLQAPAGGNKYFKLKQVLAEAMRKGITSVVSKGGMFSNHLDALAMTCSRLHLETICIVRSHQPDESNPTIQRLRHHGAQIHYVAPDAYTRYDRLHAAEQFPTSLFIPEGGLSASGIAGVRELAQFISTLGFNHVIVAGGSMCTAVGLMAEPICDSGLHLVPAWKGCTPDYIEDIAAKFNIETKTKWDLWPDDHVGGFGRWTMELFRFMMDFSSQTRIPLDPVYTGKMMFALHKQLDKTTFSRTDKILAIHTGGLQGTEGYAYRYEDPWRGYQTLIYTR